MSLIVVVLVYSEPQIKDTPKERKHPYNEKAKSTLVYMLENDL